MMTMLNGVNDDGDDDDNGVHDDGDDLSYLFL